MTFTDKGIGEMLEAALEASARSQEVGEYLCGFAEGHEASLLLCYVPYYTYQKGWRQHSLPVQELRKGARAINAAVFAFRKQKIFPSVLTFIRSINYNIRMKVGEHLEAKLA